MLVFSDAVEACELFARQRDGTAPSNCSSCVHMYEVEFGLHSAGYAASPALQSAHNRSAEPLPVQGPFFFPLEPWSSWGERTDR